MFDPQDVSHFEQSLGPKPNSGCGILLLSCPDCGEPFHRGECIPYAIVLDDWMVYESMCDACDVPLGQRRFVRRTRLSS